MDYELILIGDKVLVEPDNDKSKTEGGLYLPQGIKEKDKVQYGTIVKIGPGYPIVDPSLINSDPWDKTYKNQYFPLQSMVGDKCVFLKEQAFEVYYNKKKYFVIPHAAILMVIRSSTNIAGVSLT
ncbi:MAG: chaperonin GroS [uncultured bacterium]|nr:MAG: chaperonin GroS [uncultured bacterium]